jgi:hypothetical protein
MPRLGPTVMLRRSPTPQRYPGGLTTIVLAAVM